MIDSQVVFNVRGGGKTTWLIEQVHEYGVQNRHGEVLVVVPNASQRERFIREWRRRYPALADPNVLTMQNLIPVRGRRYEKIYIEDIDRELEGVYSERVLNLLPALEWAREPEIIFTCSPIDQFYSWPYDPEPTPEELAQIEEEERDRREAALNAEIHRRLKAWREQREQEVEEEDPGA